MKYTLYLETGKAIKFDRLTQLQLYIADNKIDKYISYFGDEKIADKMGEL